MYAKAYYTLMTCANGWTDYTSCVSLNSAKKWATQRQTFAAGSYTLEYRNEIWRKELIKCNDGTYKFSKWVKVK